MAPRLVLKQHARTWNHPTNKTDPFWLFTQNIGERLGVLVMFLEWDIDLKSGPLLLSLPSWQQIIHQCGKSLTENRHPQYQFEQMLEACNQQWELLGKTSPDILSRIRIGVALLLPEQFFFSGHGNISALFLRQVATEKFRVFDLALNVMSEAGNAGHRRPLRTVLDGNWQSHDAFILGSSHLSQTLPLESLHPWFTHLPPVTVSESIAQAFHPSNLALFLAQMAPEKEKLTGIEGEMGSAESLAKLHQTIQNTQQETGIHSSDTTRVTSLTLQGIFAALAPFLQRMRARLHPLIRRCTFTAKKILARIPPFLWQFRKRSKITLGNPLSLFRHGTSLIHLSTRSLRWAGAFTFLICLIAFGWHWRVVTAHDRLFASTFLKAEQQIREAQDALIYKNEERARTLNTDAQLLLAPLKARTPEQTDQLQKIDRLLQDQQAQLQHRFTPTIASTTFSDNPLALLNQSLLLADGSVWDIRHQIPSPLTAANGGMIREATASTDGFFVLMEDGKTVSYRPRPGFLPGPTASWTHTPHDWFSYADRLYSLEQDGIWRRIQKTDGSLTPETSWLKTETQIDPLACLAVDTSIWVAEPTRLRQFQTGQEKTIAPSITPSLERVQDMYTSTKTPWLFLLDQGGGGRVIILDKTSLKVVAQFVDSRFTDATHFFVNEASATVAVVSGNTLLQFPVSGVK